MAESHQDDINKLAEIIKGIRFAMLTTVDEDGSLRSRPMTAQDVEFDGSLWFFTRSDAPKVAEANDHRKVNVSFSDPGASKFVSASGTAVLVRDREKIRQYWKPVYKTFFPQGLDDPELALLRIDVESAEYWDAPGTKLGQMFNFVRARLTHDPGKLGRHAKVGL